MNKITFFLILAAYSFALFSCEKNSLAQSEKIPAVDNSRQSVPSAPPNDFSVPKGWTLFPKPKEGSPEMRCANYSVEREWKVETENGNLKISKYAYSADEQIEKLPLNLRQTILKNRNVGKGLGGYLYIESFEKGWLIGSDAGEWGGKLFWFSENGNHKTELLKDNIRGIARVADEIFILSGMRHLGIDEGKIFKLAKDEKGSLKVQFLIDLKTQPQTFTAKNDQSTVIAVNNKIVRLKSSGEIENLRETNFSSLYPNSMTITSSKVIYVGMRLFIVRFMQGENGFTEEWLMPQNCQKFREKNFDCACQNEK